MFIVLIIFLYIIQLIYQLQHISTIIWQLIKASKWKKICDRIFQFFCALCVVLFLPCQCPWVWSLRGKGLVCIAVCHRVCLILPTGVAKVRNIKILPIRGFDVILATVSHSLVFISLLRFLFSYLPLRTVSHVTLAIKENWGMSLYRIYCRPPTWDVP